MNFKREKEREREREKEKEKRERERERERKKDLIGKINPLLDRLIQFTFDT